MVWIDWHGILSKFDCIWSGTRRLCLISYLTTQVASHFLCCSDIRTPQILYQLINSECSSFWGHWDDAAFDSTRSRVLKLWWMIAVRLWFDLPSRWNSLAQSKIPPFPLEISPPIPMNIQRSNPINISRYGRSRHKTHDFEELTCLRTTESSQSFSPNLGSPSPPETPDSSHCISCIGNYLLLEPLAGDHVFRAAHLHTGEELVCKVRAPDSAEVFPCLSEMIDSPHRRESLTWLVGVSVGRAQSVLFNFQTVSLWSCKLKLYASTKSNEDLCINNVINVCISNL